MALFTNQTIFVCKIDLFLYLTKNFVKYTSKSISRFFFASDLEPEIVPDFGILPFFRQTYL